MQEQIQQRCSWPAVPSIDRSGRIVGGWPRLRIRALFLGSVLRTVPMRTRSRRGLGLVSQTKKEASISLWPNIFMRPLCRPVRFCSSWQRPRPEARRQTKPCAGPRIIDLQFTQNWAASVRTRLSPMPVPCCPPLIPTHCPVCLSRDVGRPPHMECSNLGFGRVQSKLSSVF